MQCDRWPDPSQSTYIFTAAPMIKTYDPNEWGFPLSCRRTNERATLRQAVARVSTVPLDIELICVDDGSTDGSREMSASAQFECKIEILLLASPAIGRLRSGNVCGNPFCSAPKFLGFP